MTIVRLFKERPAATVNTFGKRLGDFKHWRDELIEVIDEYQSWVEQQGLTNGEEDLRVYELLDQLRSDRIAICLVGEFSRGKTELLNAVFFADFKQRLLPSNPGRTTMCPTELLYDEQFEPCAKFLPIETRKSALTISEHKRMPGSWTVYALDITDPKKMADTFREITKTKRVPLAEARALGLWRENQKGVGPAIDSMGRVEIPTWRHAIVNFPHPLLKQGLIVLDTPGLNALGIEPELTLGALSHSEAVLFVLAAETGVTRSDLDVWNNHVCVAKNKKGGGRLVVLNKIDILWDELNNETAVSATVTRQTTESARALGISRNLVFPVSAQKGLLAKIKSDHALLKKSGLANLESRLSTDIIASKKQLIRDKVKREIGNIVETTGLIIEARIAAVDVQLEELHGLSGKDQDAIQRMIAQMRLEKLAYDKTLANFQTTRSVLSDQLKILLDYLSVEVFDELTSKSRQEMNESWTTRGLRTGMKRVFEGVLDAMAKATKQAQHTRHLVQSVYNQFHAEHGLAKIKPANFSLFTYRSQLQRLYDEADAFRNSPVMVMTEQHFVIKKFFITLVSRARSIFIECNGNARNWSKAIMAPILAQVREHKIMMDQRLDNLKKVHENLGNLSARIADVETSRQNLENQLNVIRSMLRKINTSRSKTR
jgi:hypothetical protein